MSNSKPSPMAKAKPRKQAVESLAINGTSLTVRVGDCVYLRQEEGVKDPYIAKVKKIYAKDYKVKVQWYWRPEDTPEGRRKFHGSKELFQADPTVNQSACTIEGKCVVHSFEDYTKLESVGPDDYYSRFHYYPKTGAFKPAFVEVNCKCELPNNPDDLMVQCEACSDWFHPECLGMTTEQVKQMELFVCTDCAAASVEEKEKEKEEKNEEEDPKEDGVCRNLDLNKD